MATVSKKELIQKMEEMKDGERLSLRLSPTFGAATVIVELNPSRKEKGQKTYLMWWGNDAVQAKAKAPFLSSNKAKSIASWIADRAAQWVVN
jgi:hypothetical protein